MFERTPELDRDSSRADRTREIRTPGRMRDGHRREYDPREAREQMSFGERSEQALGDVGIYRSVSFRDMAEAHFGGHPYTARRAVNRWIRRGLMREHTARGPKGGSFQVLTLTQRGAQKAHRAATDRGLNPQQRTWAGLVKRSELSHDTEVYRACDWERRHLLEEGATLRRIRIDAELKSAVAQRSERARVRGGREVADVERHRAAQELGLPVDEEGRVLYPDAQLEYTDAAGRIGRVNIEVASGHYRNRAILAKSNAGFALHATGAAKTRVLRALGGGRGEGHDGTRGPAERDPAAFEL